MPTITHAQAATELARRDPVLAELVAAFGPPRIDKPQQDNYAALVSAIVSQQLAGAAAAAIHGRLVAALGGDVTPERLLGLRPETLRGVGLSANKTASLCDLSARVLDGSLVLDTRVLRRADDAEVVAGLSKVRGVGRWTAEMFLIFQLNRLDVWPTGDLGVRKGYGAAWRVALPTAVTLEPLGDAYRPYRSVVAWYCWRAAERASQPAGRARSA